MLSRMRAVLSREPGVFSKRQSVQPADSQSFCVLADSVSGLWLTVYRVDIPVITVHLFLPVSASCILQLLWVWGCTHVQSHSVFIGNVPPRSWECPLLRNLLFLMLLYILQLCSDQCFHGISFPILSLQPTNFHVK